MAPVIKLPTPLWDFFPMLWTKLHSRFLVNFPYQSKFPWPFLTVYVIPLFCFKKNNSVKPSKQNCNFVLTWLNLFSKKKFFFSLTLTLLSRPAHASKDVLLLYRQNYGKLTTNFVLKFIASTHLKMLSTVHHPWRYALLSTILKRKIFENETLFRCDIKRIVSWVWGGLLMVSVDRYSVLDIAGKYF
jgi:hypothetical protein